MKIQSVSSNNYPNKNIGFKMNARIGINGTPCPFENFCPKAKAFFGEELAKKALTIIGKNETSVILDLPSKVGKALLFVSIKALEPLPLLKTNEAKYDFLWKIFHDTKTKDIAVSMGRACDNCRTRSIIN